MFSGPTSLSEVIIKMDSCLYENLANKDHAESLISMRGLSTRERSQLLSTISKNSPRISEKLIAALRKALNIGQEAEYLPGVREVLEQIRTDTTFLQGNFNNKRDPYKYD